MTKYNVYKRIIHWLLIIVVVLYLISGFGITEFRTVESITFELLTKNLAFKIHNNLWIPFLVLLALHVYFSLVKKRVKVKRK